jgi:hypothetical protein
MTLESGANSQQSTPAARALFDSSPEEITALRIAVRDWLKRGRKALESFSKNDGTGTFHLDSEAAQSDAQKYFNTTTTARSYTGRMVADWRAPDSIVRKQQLKELSAFLSAGRYTLEADKTGTPLRIRSTLKADKQELNNFDVAHTSDYLFAFHYANRFYPEKKVKFKFCENHNWNPEQVSDFLARFVRGTLKKNDQNKDGQILLEPRVENSKHFFVTLHSLRALAITKVVSSATRPKGPISEAVISEITKYCKTFCIQQCFYAGRQHRHEFDATNLVFALAIYAMYDRNVDKDLCIACLEAIRGSQQSSGSWPATHPIMRDKAKPWHITSHEIALCMTWLYFQPAINDQGRAILLQMMERYFQNWVAKTHIIVDEYSGWFDDHTRTRDRVSGWATAIVCHFLANYEFLLSDHLNRRVIESLGIEVSCEQFLIDEDAHKKSDRWGRETSGPRIGATWPDLPPFSWTHTEKRAVEIASDIRKLWTDPEWDGDEPISYRLADRALKRIFETPNERPNKRDSSFILPGSPGTRKTSLVKVIAQILRWPLITVPASIFFDRGFDLLETRATEIFRRLNYLCNCVIFFDEFEEFFRQRPRRPKKGASSDEESCAAESSEGQSTAESSEGQSAAELPEAQQPGRGTASQDQLPRYSTHDRTIAAFMTASMLPRLQDLHNEGRNLIFLATNNVGALDEAIRRPGRFDLEVDLQHPTIAAATEFLKSPNDATIKSLLDIPFKEKVTQEQREQVEGAATKVSKILRKKNVSEILRKRNKGRIPFKNLDAALDCLLKDATAMRKAEDEISRDPNEWTPKL